MTPEEKEVLYQLALRWLNEEGNDRGALAEMAWATLLAYVEKLMPKDRIYSVQHQVNLPQKDFPLGWQTARGYYATELADAIKEKAHLEVNYEELEFRLVTAEIGEWTEVPQ